MAVFCLFYCKLYLFNPVFGLFRRPRTTNISLRSGQSRDGYAERRAGNIRQTDFVAEFYGRRIAAMFAANAAGHTGTRLSAQFHRHLHQLADAHGIKARKRIGFINLVRIVRGQELACVVAREAERHLRQVVRTEAEEFRLFRNLVRRQRRAGNFNHRTYFVLQIGFRSRNQLVRRLNNDVFHELQFFHFAGKRNHDFGNDVPVRMSCLHGHRRLNHGFRLHHGDFGIRYRQTATAVSHHRVEFVQRIDDFFNLLHALVLRLRQCFDIGFFRRHELVKRGIEETDGYGITAQRFEQPFEVRLLHRFDFYWKLLVAFIPAAILGFLFSDKIDELLESVTVVAVMLVIGGVFMLFCDRIFTKGSEDTVLTEKKAFSIGLFQCIAMIPGVSRSMATIVGGMAQKLTRKEAAEFSFFLAVPTMFAATGYKVLKLFLDGGTEILMNNMPALIIGNVVAFIVALLAIKFFISFVTKYGFKAFGWYRIIVGGAILVMLLMGYNLQIG